MIVLDSRHVTWRRMLPYGIWTCPDGHEVLFNRHYHPILERLRGGRAMACRPDDWIEWIAQDYFFNDSDPPWHHSPPVRTRTLARINEALRDWGADTLPPMPRRSAGPDNLRLPRNPWLLLLPPSQTPDLHRRPTAAQVATPEGPPVSTTLEPRP